MCILYGLNASLIDVSKPLNNYHRLTERLTDQLYNQLANYTEQGPS